MFLFRRGDSPRRRERARRPLHGALLPAVLPLLLLAACDRTERQAGSVPPAGERASGDAGLKLNRQHKLPASHFMRGKFTGSISLDPTGSDAVETGEERRRAEALIARLQGGQTSPGQAREIMAEARQLDTAAVLRVAEPLLQHADEDVRAEALMLADGASTTAALPLLRHGLQDASPDIRALAMEAVRQINDPAVQPLVDAGLDDPSEAVRQFALQAGSGQDGQIREDTFLKALASPHEDLALAALAEAEATPDKNILPHVIGALGHKSAEVRESAHEMLFLLLGESFSSASQARAWWAANKSKFDDDLVLADLARIEELAAQSAAAVSPK